MALGAFSFLFLLKKLVNEQQAHNTPLPSLTHTQGGVANCEGFFGPLGSSPGRVVLKCLVESKAWQDAGEVATLPRGGLRSGELSPQREGPEQAVYNNGFMEGDFTS